MPRKDEIAVGLVDADNRGSEAEVGSRKSLEEMVRPARFEGAAFSSGGENGEEPTTSDYSSE